MSLSLYFLPDDNDSDTGDAAEGFALFAVCVRGAPDQALLTRSFGSSELPPLGRSCKKLVCSLRPVVMAAKCNGSYFRKPFAARSHGIGRRELCV